MVIGLVFGVNVSGADESVVEVVWNKLTGIVEPWFLVTPLYDTAS